MYCIISTKFSQGVTCYHKCSLESVFISRQWRENYHKWKSSICQTQFFFAFFTHFEP
jgi:hypothetical protein